MLPYSIINHPGHTIPHMTLAIATQLDVFPIFDPELAFGEHLIIGMAFVGGRLVREYALRRLFAQISLARHSGDDDGHPEPAPIRR